MASSPNNGVTFSRNSVIRAGKTGNRGRKQPPLAPHLPATRDGEGGPGLTALQRPGPAPCRLYSCMAFREIRRCKSAAARQFRARKRLKYANQGMKWPPPPTMVSLFPETVSSGPEKRGIGGENNLRWLHHTQPYGSERHPGLGRDHQPHNAAGPGPFRNAVKARKIA